MDRTNETWLRQLSAAGPQQAAALSDLREALLRGLRRALSGRPGADDAFQQDAAQDALVRILDRLAQFEGRSRFLTWATSIAIRVALSDLRRQRWKDVSLDALVSDANFTPQPAVDDDSRADSESERRAVYEKMHEVIQNELTEKQRTALVAELRGMPQDEIAHQLGSNRNALYKLSHDARKRLKQGLEAAGFDAAYVRAVLDH